MGEWRKHDTLRTVLCDELTEDIKKMSGHRGGKHSQESFPAVDGGWTVVVRAGHTSEYLLSTRKP